jgi:hypothetical protein
MVVACRVSDADPNDDVAEPRGIGKCNTHAPEIIGGVKRELVDARFEPRGRQERDVSSTVSIGGQPCQLATLCALQEMELDDQALRRSSASHIEYVRRKMCQMNSRYEARAPTTKACAST